MNVGTLYIIATPIGNLGDLTDRAKRLFSEVDYVAAEDTRQSLKILRHLELEKPIIRADEVFQRKRPETILEKLLNGQHVALVTDAGTPGISDPGSYIVDQCYQASIPVCPIPGPSAMTTALSISGFKVVPFTFFGFIPKKGREKKEMIQTITMGPYATCFFESPYRLHKTLNELATHAPDRMVFVCRELTKKFEQTYRGPLKTISELFSQKAPKGECTIVVGPLE